MGSGSNAPLYTTSFSTRPKAQEDSEAHENRLAEALGLDRVARVLDFRDPLVVAEIPDSSGKKKRDQQQMKTVWMGTEWIMGSSTPSMLNSDAVYFMILC